MEDSCSSSLISSLSDSPNFLKATLLLDIAINLIEGYFLFRHKFKFIFTDKVYLCN